MFSRRRFDFLNMPRFSMLAPERFSIEFKGHSVLAFSIIRFSSGIKFRPSFVGLIEFFIPYFFPRYFQVDCAR